MLQTKVIVESKHGVQQVTLLRPVLRSVAVRLVHAQIHYADYVKLFDAHFTAPLQNGFEPEELLFCGFGEDGVGANNSFFIRAEAHVYACLQALHAVTDNMSHVVYYALGWNLENRPPLENTSFKTIKKRLTKEATESTWVKAICKVFESLENDNDFKALQNATNHIKHHGGLPIVVGPNDDDGEPFTGKLQSYRRHNDVINEDAILERIERSHSTIRRFVVEAGCALNEILLHSR
jgi:hypothetical protein